MARGIACIGWGSLLWDPRSLPLREPFREGGPRLPVEFSRVARDGRVTLAIDPEAREIDTYFCRLEVDSVSEAVAALGRRERIEPERHAEWIGLEALGAGEASRGEADRRTRERMRVFLAQEGLEAVVWTALPRRGSDGRFEAPTTEALLDHLHALDGPARVRAEEYVRRAPAAVDTVRRRAFEASLGWTPSRLPPNEPMPGFDEETK